MHIRRPKNNPLNAPISEARSDTVAAQPAVESPYIDYAFLPQQHRFRKPGGSLTKQLRATGRVAVAIGKPVLIVGATLAHVAGDSSKNTYTTAKELRANKNHQRGKLAVKLGAPVVAAVALTSPGLPEHTGIAFGPDAPTDHPQASMTPHRPQPQRVPTATSTIADVRGSVDTLLCQLGGTDACTPDHKAPTVIDSTKPLTPGTIPAPVDQTCAKPSPLQLITKDCPGGPPTYNGAVITESNPYNLLTGHNPLRRQFIVGASTDQITAEGKQILLDDDGRAVHKPAWNQPSVYCEPRAKAPQKLVMEPGFSILDAYTISAQQYPVQTLAGFDPITTRQLAVFQAGLTGPASSTAPLLHGADSESRPVAIPLWQACGTHSSNALTGVFR